MLIYSLLSNNQQETLNVANLFVKQFLTNNTKKTCNIIYLIGNLGAGKTTFMRGLLTSCGFFGSVKSPTYTIVETYPNLAVPIYHFDLYRLKQPHELELIGIRDYLNDKTICCFEWPEQGFGHIPPADFTIKFKIIADHSRQIDIHHHNCNNLII